MGHAAETAVVVLNWNGADLLPLCLSALAAQNYRDFDLWLVDNGSIDGSAKLLDDLEKSPHPAWIGGSLPAPPMIIRNESNLGFAAGNNQAIRLCRSRFVVTLNNDAVAAEDWLLNLTAAARRSEGRVGMVASTMLFHHLPRKVASAGISVHRDGLALERALGMDASAVAQAGARPVFGPSAGAALYTREMLEDTGLFDERFFSYLEDADLAWRARWRGWRAVHEPGAVVRHIYSATGGRDSEFKRRHIARNRVWTIYKNMPEALLRRFATSIAGYDALAVLRGVAVRDRASVAGRLEALRLLSAMTTDRRKITTSALVHPNEMAGMLAPALRPRTALKYRRRLNALLATAPAR